MEKTIWKFELVIENCQNIRMPKDAEILTVQTQNEKPCIWALVDPKAETELRTFEIFGTGHPVLYDAGVSRKYINTFQMASGALIFHVFEYTGV